MALNFALHTFRIDFSLYGYFGLDWGTEFQLVPILLSRKTLAEIVNIDSRYLANIENEGTIPSLPVIIQLIKVCGLPVERYFNPEVMREESAQRQRISHKLKLCPEQYLTIIEGALDGALKTKESANETEGL